MTEHLCHGEDPELWFHGTKRATKKAVAICKRCPMIDACRQHALDNQIRYGIWGGQTESERDRILRPRKASKRAKRENPLPKPGPSPVRGVSWNQNKERWVVALRHGGRIHWMGQFVKQKDAETAAIAKCEELYTTTVRSRTGKKAA